jgi:hypothetical protein
MLTAERIRRDLSDQDLLNLLCEEALRLLPSDVSSDQHYDSLPSIPTGLRCLSGIWDLDVSMNMDDIAWHFTNHNEERHIQETIWSLRELEATEVLSLFEQAVSIVRPHLATLQSRIHRAKSAHTWLTETGIQAACDPLSKRLWAIKSEFPLNGFV